MHEIKTLTSISMLEETYTVRQTKINNLYTYNIEKTNPKKLTFWQRAQQKATWYDSLEEAIEACNPISIGHLTLQLMLLGFTIYGIDLNSPSDENPRKFDIYEFSGL